MSPFNTHSHTQSSDDGLEDGNKKSEGSKLGEVEG